jgi:hypothetical protein
MRYFLIFHATRYCANFLYTKTETTHGMSTYTSEKPIAIFHEHPDWFRPLFNELDARGIAYERLNAAAHT